MRNMRMKTFTCGIVLLTVSCAAYPKPAREEIAARDQWGALLPEKVRQGVIEEAERHTGWADKRKVLYEIERFQHLYRDQQRKAKATQPSTRSATRP